MNTTTKLRQQKATTMPKQAQSLSLLSANLHFHTADCPVIPSGHGTSVYRQSRQSIKEHIKLAFCIHERARLNMYRGSIDFSVFKSGLGLCLGSEGECMKLI